MKLTRVCVYLTLLFFFNISMLSVEPTAVAKLPSGEIVMAGIASDVIESSKRTRRSADTVFSSSNSNDSAADDRSETLLDLDDKQNRPPRFPFLNAIFSGIVSNIVNNRPNGLLANLFGLNSLRSTVSITQTQVISVRIPSFNSFSYVWSLFCRQFFLSSGSHTTRVNCYYDFYYYYARPVI